MRVNIIGAGLTGAEAAWQVARRGVEVSLYEMRPLKQTPAHKGANFAELVCSNSLRAAGLTNAVGVLKEEIKFLQILRKNQSRGKNFESKYNRRGACRRGGSVASCKTRRRSLFVRNAPA